MTDRPCPVWLRFVPGAWLGWELARIWNRWCEEQEP
jgi:hypothetical protein